MELNDYARLVDQKANSPLDVRLLEERSLKSGERKKVALRKGRGHAVLHFFLLHALPLGAAMFLITLNARQYYFGDTQTWLGALQFAARAHDLLMQISISAIALAYLQYFMTKASLPYGAFMCSLRSTSLDLRAFREFYAAVTTKSFGRMATVIFILIIPSTFLLAAVGGAASAVAMIPRPVQLRVPDVQVGCNLSTSVLFPANLSAAGVSLSSDYAAFPDQNNNLEARGRSPAVGWLTLRQLPPANAMPHCLSNITDFTNDNFADRTWTLPQVQQLMLNTQTWATNNYGVEYNPAESGVYRRPVYIQYAPNSTLASTPSSMLYREMNSGSPVQGNVDRQGRMHWPILSMTAKQAFVSVICHLNPITNDTLEMPLQFPDRYLAGAYEGGNLGDWASGCLPDIHLQNWTGVDALSGSPITRADLWKDFQARQQSRVIWIEDLTTINSSRTALGAVVVMPQTCTTDGSLAVSACSIGATWADTDLTFTSLADDTPVYDPNNHLEVIGTLESAIEIDTMSSLGEWSSPSVKLSANWTNSLNSLTNLGNRTVIDNLLHWLPDSSDFCPAPYQLPNGTDYNETSSAFQGTVGALNLGRVPSHETILAGLIAMGMSRSGDVSSVYWGDDSRNVNPASTATIHGVLYGYGYSLSTVTDKLAVVVLCLYIAFALTYSVYTIWTGHSSLTWSSLADVIALALNSRPSPEMENCGAGIERLNTLRKSVSLRENANEDLEMGFDHTDETEQGLTSGLHARVTWNKAY